MRLYMSILLVLSTMCQAMENSPSEKHNPLKLQQYCFNKLTSILSEPPQSKLREQAPFKTALLTKSQQESARYVQANMLPHLLKQLKRNIVLRYKQYLEGSPWQMLLPSLPVHTSKNESEALYACDYSCEHQLSAIWNSTEPELLKLVHEKKSLMKEDQIIHIGQCKKVQSVAFTPQCSHLVICHMDEAKNKAYTLIPLLEARENWAKELFFKIPMKESDKSVKLLFSADDHYAIHHCRDRLEIFDLHKLSNKLPNSFLKFARMTRKFKEVALNPTNYQCATRDSLGNIDIFDITPNNALSFLATMRCAQTQTKMHWLACGTKLLIQSRRNTIFWDPMNDNKANTQARLPYIASYQVAHSPCQKYLAYRTLRGVCIYNLKTNEWSRIENYYPDRMQFDNESTLVGIENNTQLIKHRSYEYHSMPLDQLIIFCLLSKYIVKAPQDSNFLSLLSNANILSSQKGFVDLPNSIREHLFTQMYRKLQSAATLKDPQARIVICINDSSRVFTVEFPD